MNSNTRLTWVEISSSAIRHNWLSFQRLLGPSVEILPVIKSNAYGHGLLEVAKILSPLAKRFAVVSGTEAINLHRAGINKPIIVLSYFPVSQLAEMSRLNVTLPIYDWPTAQQVSLAGQHRRRPFPVHVKIDTGTSRVGFLPKELPKQFTKIARLPGIRIVSLFSHFADAENSNQNFTKRQSKLFDQLRNQYCGNVALEEHIACTAAALLRPEARHHLVRMGIGLYGYWPSSEVQLASLKIYPAFFSLRPVLSWHTRIIQVKSLPAGSTVGYGRTYRTKRPLKLAVLPVGYWDGYDRSLSNVDQVIVRGRRAKVRGRICMNLTMVDVTNIPNVKSGDRVTLIGQQGNEFLSADELATKAGTIHYELLTRINSQIPRLVLD